MKTKLYLAILLWGITWACQAQQTHPLEKWKGLMGEWKGEGSGKPGQGGGTFSFEYKLDNRIIERKSHSEYPAAKDKPLIIHDDLMIIYPDSLGIPSKAVYFDNEGHVLNYSITYPAADIVFTTEKNGNAPVFRLSYTRLDSNTVNTKFEMSRNGVDFMTYVEGKSKKVE